MIPASSPSQQSRQRKPRASGDDPAVVGDLVGNNMVNPARAGMIPSPRTRRTAWTSKPRASGDDPLPFAS